MAQRSFDDGFWGDPFVQDLTKDGKLLFLYLWTNKRCNPAAIYEITPKTIAFETGLSQQDLPELFKAIEEKVRWFPDENIVWVKNFVKRQPRSPQFLRAVANCLKHISRNGLVQEFISYNEEMSIYIPYDDGIDTVSIPNIEGIDRHTDLDIDKDLDNTKGTTQHLSSTLKGGRSLQKYPAEHIGMRRDVFAGLKERRGYTSRNPNAEAQAISQMLVEGFSVESIVRAYDIIKDQPFYRDKNLSMMQVRKDIHEVLKNGAHQNSISGDTSRQGRKYFGTDRLKRGIRQRD